MSRMLALKTDGGSGAPEQMVLAEYCTRHFSRHVPDLRRRLRAKLVCRREFGVPAPGAGIGRAG